MLTLANRCCILLLALPLFAAAADPVTVTTRSSGLLDPHPIVLNALGLDDPAFYAGVPLPYVLTIGSTFGPAGPGYFDNGQRVEDYNNDVAISLAVGTHTYNYAGAGSTNAQAFSTTSYGHEIAFVPPETGSYFMTVSQFVTDPGGSLGGHPLAPRTLHLGPGAVGSVRFTTIPVNPDAPGFWSMAGNAETTSLQVVSAIPEPTQLGMFAAGMLTLGLWRRRADSDRRRRGPGKIMQR